MPKPSSILHLYRRENFLPRSSHDPGLHDQNHIAFCRPIQNILHNCDWIGADWTCRYRQNARSCHLSSVNDGFAVLTQKGTVIESVSSPNLRGIKKKFHLMGARLTEVYHHTSHFIIWCSFQSTLLSIVVTRHNCVHLRFTRPHCRSGGLVFGRFTYSHDSFCNFHQRVSVTSQYLQKCAWILLEINAHVVAFQYTKSFE